METVHLAFCDYTKAHFLGKMFQKAVGEMTFFCIFMKTRNVLRDRITG